MPQRLKSDTATKASRAGAPEEYFRPSLAEAEGIFMAVAATIQNNLSSPEVYFAASSEQDIETRRRLIRLLGTISLEATISSEQEAAETASLPTVAKEYFTDDPKIAERAGLRLKTDFRTNVFEILRESGHVSISHSVYSRDGFYQSGYSQRAMYAHGVLHTDHPVENRRRVAETLNELRIEDGFLAGRFDNHFLVEVSRSPDQDEMSDQTSEKYGYNTRTRKAMLRCTEVNQSGERITASASVLGANAGGQRYDQRGVRNIYYKLQLTPSEVSSSANLENAFWVNKSLLPGGIIDVVRAYDQGLAQEAFCGVIGQKGNYETLIEQSLNREQQIEQELNAEVRALALSLQNVTCDQALQIMARQAKDYATELCVQDKQYDPTQFGYQAAKHIQQARYYAQAGMDILFRQELADAKQKAIVFMCGMSLRGISSIEGTEVENSNSSSSDNCEYISSKCPLCRNKNVRTIQTKTTITCGTCHKSVTRSAPQAA